MNHNLEILLKMPLFREFTKEELEQMLRDQKCRLKRYQKDQLIHLEHEKCRSMDIILKGRLAVQNIDENGNVLTIGVFAEGDTIGANLLFSSRNTYPMTVISSRETILLQFERELVLQLCRQSETFMMILLTVISDKAIVLTDKINAISLKTIRQCLTEYLKYEEKLQGTRVIRLTMSKKELAERLGIQRSSLSRELNKMRKGGLLDYDAKKIIIKNL